MLTTEMIEYRHKSFVNPVTILNFTMQITSTTFTFKISSNSKGICFIEQPCIVTTTVLYFQVDHMQNQAITDVSVRETVYLTTKHEVDQDSVLTLMSHLSDRK